jgi:hypothetical protein
MLFIVVHLIIKLAQVAHIAMEVRVNAKVLVKDYGQMIQKSNAQHYTNSAVHQVIVVDQLHALVQENGCNVSQELARPILLPFHLTPQLW